MTATNMPFQTLNQNLDTDNDLGYGQLFAILVRRKFWVLGAVVAALAIAVVHTVRQDPVYISSMQLLVESNYQSKKNDAGGDIIDVNIQSDMATQLSLMQSSSLIQRAMLALKENYPDEFNPQDPASFIAFRKSLKLSQVGSGDKKAGSATKIFQVDYVDNDPIKTQQVLQAVQKVYQDYNLEQQEERLVKGLDFINKQLPEARDQVTQAETALERFRQNQGVIDPEQQAQAHVAMINTVDQDLRVNDSQLRELNTRYQGLLQQVGMSPEQALLASRLTQSSRYQAILNQIQETELAIIQQKLRFTELTPQVQQLSEQRQQQLGQLAMEMGRALNTEVGGGNGEGLLFQGQLSASDVDAINELIGARLNLDTAVARQQSLLRARQQLVSEIRRYPSLLAEYGRLLPEIVTNRETLQLLLKAQQELGLEIAKGGFDWKVVEEPLYGYKIGPDFKKNLLLGAVAGFMVGGMAAFGREALDDLVHTSADLQKQVPIPLLGMVPVIRVEGSDFGRSPRHLGAEDAALAPAMKSILRWQGFREAMDLVYQNIHLVNASGALKSLVVTSALPGEGKSTLALGLAFSAARLHRRVLLIDGDLRRPSLHKLMNLPNQEGLSTFLTEDGKLPPHLLPVTAEEAGRTGVSVLTAGPIPGDPAKLLSSRRMREMMESFEQYYDLVIVDAPPASGMVDAIVTATHCDGVLMVGRMDRLTKTELTQSLENLRHLNVIGVVANGVSRLRQQYAYVANA